MAAACSRDASSHRHGAGRKQKRTFGCTFCPDLCPTALNEIAGALAQLGPLAAQVQPVFVSIDPQRDTPKALREYVENFDARILPLSGNAEQLARVAASVGVVFYKVSGPTPDEYTFAHNAIVTLVGPEGGIVTRFSSDAVVDDLARRPGRLVDPGKAAWRIGMRSRYVRTPGEGGTGGRQNSVRESLLGGQSAAGPNAR